MKLLLKGCGGEFWPMVLLPLDAKFMNFALRSREALRMVVSMMGSEDRFSLVVRGASTQFTDYSALIRAEDIEMSDANVSIDDFWSVYGNAEENGAISFNERLLDWSESYAETSIEVSEYGIHFSYRDQEVTLAVSWNAIGLRGIVGDPIDDRRLYPGVNPYPGEES